MPNPMTGYYEGLPRAERVRLFSGDQGESRASIKMRVLTPVGDVGRAVRPDRSCPPASFVSCRFRCGWPVLAVGRRGESAPIVVGARPCPAAMSPTIR